MLAITVVFGGVTGFLSMVFALMAGASLMTSLTLYSIVGFGTVLLVLAFAGFTHLTSNRPVETASQNLGDAEITPIPVWTRRITD